MNMKNLLGVAVVAGLALAIGYLLGGRQTPGVQAPEAIPNPPTEPAVVQPQSVQLAEAAGEPALPANHPAMPGPRQPTGHAHAEGPADPNAQFTHFRVGQRNVKRIVADGGYMWVGTSGGLIRYDVKTDEYRLFDLRSGLLANGIFHIGKIDGRLTVGTYGGGMAILNDDHESWKIYNIPQGLGDAFVYDTLETPSGDVWIATWSGANRVRGGRLDDRGHWDLFTVESTGGGLPNNWVYGLHNGTDGEVWMATEGGLARFKDEQWQNWQHEDGLGAPYDVVQNQIQFMNDPAEFSRHHARQKTEMGLQKVDVAYNPNYVVALLVGDDGIVWCGTWGGGLARFDGRQWTNYTVADGLPGNHVFSLHLDPASRLWVGTSNGLALHHEDGFKVYTTDQGLFSNTVFSMATGPDGSAWVGSFGGVARVKQLQ